MLQRKSIWLAVVLVLAACAEVPPNEVLYSDARAVVATTPPPARVEVVPAPPALNWNWVPGHWSWQNSQHVWVAGHWLEPRPGQVYVQAYWTQEGGRWIYHEGRWQSMGTPQQQPVAIVTAPPQSQQTVAIVTAPPQSFVAAPAPQQQIAMIATTEPPLPRVESVPISPGPNYFWIGGHWKWEAGQYLWVPGYWEASRAGWYWIPAHWVRDGPTWRYASGYWQRIS